MSLGYVHLEVGDASKNNNTPVYRNELWAMNAVGLI